MCVELDYLHGEDGSHDTMCSSYHNSMGFVDNDMDASLIWLSSRDWRYDFLVWIFCYYVMVTIDAFLYFGIVHVLLRPGCIYMLWFM